MKIRYDENHWRTLIGVIVERIGFEKLMDLAGQAETDRRLAESGRLAEREPERPSNEVRMDA